MTQDEAIKKIISKPKFYIGKMPQSTASNFVASWRKGMAKQKTINVFLSKFGYVKIKEAVWSRDKHIEGYTKVTQEMLKDFDEKDLREIYNKWKGNDYL